MNARMTNPVVLLDGAFAALNGVSDIVAKSDLPATLTELTNLRVSQINGCAVCLDLHARGLKRLGETDERLATVAGWRDTPYFTDAERAALALAEAVTRLADRADPVPDATWNEAAAHFDEQQLGALVLSIATINVWNRLNVTTRQVTGPWVADIIPG